MDTHITPEKVLPLLDGISTPLYEALRSGCSFADSIQPDLAAGGAWFWSHCARFSAQQMLASAQSPDWSLVKNVPNNGIHLTIGGIHKVRVVKSLGGEIPPPGRNKARRTAWVGIAQQLTFNLPTTGCDSIPALSLIADWHLDEDREPVIHLSLPRGPWRYGQDPRCEWRVHLSPGSSLGIDDLAFSGGDEGDPLIEIAVDPPEWGAG
jgi:hypothetical protein